MSILCLDDVRVDLDGRVAQAAVVRSAQPVGPAHDQPDEVVGGVGVVIIDDLEERECVLEFGSAFRLGDLVAGASLVPLVGSGDV